MRAAKAAPASDLSSPSQLARGSRLWPNAVNSKCCNTLCQAADGHPPIRNGRRPWTPDEEMALSRLCGRLQLEDIGRRLGRSENAVVVRMKRLGIRRPRTGLTENFSDCYTKSAVARIFGVDSHKVTAWIHSGELRASRAPTRSTIWRIREEDIFTFIEDHPTDYCPALMEEGIFRDYALEWQDIHPTPTYCTPKEAAQLAGCHTETVLRHIERGWLRAIHLEGEHRQRWFIPKVELDRWRAWWRSHGRRAGGRKLKGISAACTECNPARR